MDVSEAIRERRSIRAYADAPVSDGDLRLVLEAGRLAPSAKNAQEWRFVVVRDADRRAELCEAAFDQKFVAEAPVVIAACIARDGRVMRCGVRADIFDVALAVENMCLQAVELGLGTCIIGSFDQERAKRILDVPAEATMVELLTLGVPAGPHPARGRLPVEQIVSYEKWSEHLSAT
jgi:nitroreductase